MACEGRGAPGAAFRAGATRGLRSPGPRPLPGPAPPDGRLPAPRPGSCRTPAEPLFRVLAPCRPWWWGRRWTWPICVPLPRTFRVRETPFHGVGCPGLAWNSPGQAPSPPRGNAKCAPPESWAQRRKQPQCLPPRVDLLTWTQTPRSATWPSKACPEVGCGTDGPGAPATTSAHRAGSRVGDVPGTG